MIRFASVNIEGHKHLDRVLPFLSAYRPDAVCIQEMMEPDISFFERELGMKSLFTPMCREHLIPLDETAPMSLSGLAFLTSHPIISHRVRYYVGTRDTLPTFVKNPETGTGLTNKAVLAVTMSCAGELYTCATTHFTWSNHGATTDEQRADLKKLFSTLDTMPEFILAGDFNAPRGREIFSVLAARYKDNIPPEYTTSIDKNLHRAGDLGFMVDGLFTTPQYKAEEVKLTDGVSDHFAITALISRVA